MTGTIRSLARRWLSPAMLVRARVIERGLPAVRWGNLRRTRPISESYGFDRGTPIDRFYLDRFLSAHAAAITGTVLEIQVNSYTKKFGRDVRVSHTLDITPQFAPTHLCDLALADRLIPEATYDCVLLPNTLQHLRDLEPALKNAMRMLKPGGTLLASAAGLARLTEPNADFWRCSAEGWRLIAARVWPGCEVEIDASGNCLAAVAGLHGIAVEELDAHELEYQDDRFPVLITICCRKP